MLKEKWLAIQLFVIHGRMLNLKLAKGKGELTIHLIFLNEEKSKIFQSQQVTEEEACELQWGQHMRCTFGNLRVPFSMCDNLNLAKAVRVGRPGRELRCHWVLITARTRLGSQRGFNS